MPRVRSRTLPVAEILIAGPFRGMRDAPEATTLDPALASLVQNMVRTPGPVGGGLTGRPGFTGMSTGVAISGTIWDDIWGDIWGDIWLGTSAATGALGAPGARTGQAVLTWTDAAGVRITVAVCGGLIYTYDWTADTWTEDVTTANLTTNSVTLSTSAKVALVPFADGLVVSDGVNTPFWWDGSSGAGGITKMTNAPIFYGPPTVYYSKLIGIKASARRTMVWSEEGDPNLGYEAGGYNNAWDNPGGYADPLTAVVGTNEALYVFRERVSLGITGAIGPDFATAGTRANLSERVGTLSPWGTIVVPQGVVIVDADAQPWLMRFGQAEPTGLWSDCRQTVRDTPRAALATVQSVIDDATRSLVIAMPAVGESNPSRCLVFALDDGLQFVGLWSWEETMDRIGSVVDDDGIARWVHFGENDGFAYAHGTLEAGPWDDALAAGTAYIAHTVATPSLGYDLDRELVFHQIEAAITGDGVSRIAVSYETPRGQSNALTVNLTGTSVGGSWDLDDWDDFVWGGTTREQRFRVGLAGRGRWGRFRVTHSESGEAFGVSVVRVRAFATQGNPQSP